MGGEGPDEHGLSTFQVELDTIFSSREMGLPFPGASIPTVAML